jgi:hypothetical protein
MKKILFLVIVILSVVVFAFVLLNKPPKSMSKAEQEAALTKLLGRKLNLSDKPVQKEYGLFKGKYVSFAYPNDAKPFDDQNKPEGAYFDKTALESFTFSLESPFRWVSVSVSPMPKGLNGLEEYPAIRVRQLDPTTYKQSEIISNGNKGLQYETPDNSSGTEKEAIFEVNNRIYTIHVQGGSKDGVANLYNRIISSLKFL